jgi:hypothetical protein
MWYEKLDILHSKTVLANKTPDDGCIQPKRGGKEREKINKFHCGQNYSVWMKNILMQQDA